MSSHVTAARAARFALRSLQLQRALLGALAAGPGPAARMARKRDQVEAIEAFLRAHARGEHGDFNPGAASALRAA